MSDAGSVDGDAVVIRPTIVTEPDEAAPAVPEPRVEVVRNDEAQRYELLIDDRLAAVSEFRMREGRTVFVHTETLPSYKGRGAATRLVAAALADVRDRGGRVVAKCPFVRAFLAEHHEFDDILDDA